MIPDYCVSDLPNTGASIAALVVLAALFLCAGWALRKGRRRAGLAAFAALTLTPLTLLGIQPAHANDGGTPDCPPGYHYVPPKPAPTPAPTPTPTPTAAPTPTPAPTPGGPTIVADEIGYQGLELNVTGTGFTGTAPVTITLDDGTPIHATATDGTFTDAFTIPSATYVGQHTVTATQGDLTATTTVMIQRDPQAQAERGKELQEPTTYQMNAYGIGAHSGSGIVNWDIAKATVRAYYGWDAKAGKVNLTDSPYIQEMKGLTAQWSGKVKRQCEAAVAAGQKPVAVFDTDDTTLYSYEFEEAIEFAFHPAKALAWYEGKTYTDPGTGRVFDYTNPAGGPNYMPATPGMIDVVKAAKAGGCTIIGLTGRGVDLADYSLENLKRAGYVDEAGQPIFTKANYFTNSGKFQQGYGGDTGQATFDLGPDGLGFCTTRSPKCQTVEFKAGTREHLQADLGYTVVGSFGDQWSDLQGGRAQAWYKLPNPSYYLPDGVYDRKDQPTYTGSHPLAGWEAKDRAAGMAPATVSYTIADDGFSGKAAGVKGDSLPNMDIVKANLRTYYNSGGNRDLKVPAGIANKSESPYITEMKGVQDKVIPDVAAQCKSLAAKGAKPAVVFDTDDTTLSTYDMEDYGMNWAFTPALQDAYFFATEPFTKGFGPFPAPYTTGEHIVGADGKAYNYLVESPGMPRLVKELKAAGCEVFGLTGRKTHQAQYSVDNLTHAGYVDDAGKPLFTIDKFFTKFTGKGTDTMPDYLVKPCAADVEKYGKCKTVAFKSGTRAHIENDLGYNIVANFGDQWTDLRGGYADLETKLPNPTYYLP